MPAFLNCLQEPGRRWWQRRRVSPAAAADLHQLHQLEDSLSAEEVAHFRCVTLLLMAVCSHHTFLQSSVIPAYGNAFSTVSCI